ncbi:hypothetical protein C8J56DRAFT_1063279 [Mycena floridula]|nr:hypothetical protein C8J56DRAFT_1063279 [Mycena floridula]
MTMRGILVRLLLPYDLLPYAPGTSNQQIYMYSQPSGPSNLQRPVAPYLGYPSTSPAPSPSQSLSHISDSPMSSLNKLENKFALDHVFHGVFAKPETGTRKPRGIFHWPADTVDLKEKKLRTVFNCMHRAGFETLGGFLADVFDAEANYQDTSVNKTIASFLECQELNPRYHPVAVVDNIYRNPLSQKLHKHSKEATPDPIFTFPQHCHPVDHSTPPVTELNTTRNALLNWSAMQTIEHIDTEAAALCELKMFTRKPQEKFTWASILEWSLSAAQELIFITAPVIFALFCTIAVSADVRKKLKRTNSDPSAVSTPGPEPSPVLEPDSDDESDGEEPSAPDKFFPPSTGVRALNIRRDPWPCVTVSILALIYIRYKCASVFPTLIGVFLFSCNANLRSLLV